MLVAPTVTRADPEEGILKDKHAEALAAVCLKTPAIQPAVLAP